MVFYRKDESDYTFSFLICFFKSFMPESVEAPFMDRSRFTKRKKTQKETASSDEGPDLISNLPEELKEKILSYLPTREAVQTCILSSRWRNTWASVRDVSISYSDFNSPAVSERKTQVRFIKFIDLLLYLHKGPIFKFKLETWRRLDSFDRWIFHLSRRNELRELYLGRPYMSENWPTCLFSCHALSVLSLHGGCIKLPRVFEGFNLMRVLDLKDCSISKADLEKILLSCPLLDEVALRSYYDLPTSLFTCHGLSILRLAGCCIKLPRRFEGFKQMRLLELQACAISGDDLEIFVSSCPLLNELALIRVRPLVIYTDHSLQIYAPKLKKLIIRGKFVHLALKTPCLVKACVELEAVPSGISGRANLVEALGALPEVEALGLYQQFLVYLAAGSLPHLPSRLNKLKMLALDVNLAAPEEVSLARLLLQNAPNLKELILVHLLLLQHFRISNYVSYLSMRDYKREIHSGCRCGIFHQKTNSTREKAPNSGELWKIDSGVMYRSLCVVELFVTSISWPALAFLKFILGSAPLLERVTVIMESYTAAAVKEIVVEFLEMSPRLSMNVQIIFR